MYSTFQYLWHWLTAVNEHSLHAPYIYDLYTKTIKKKVDLEDFNAIEQARKVLEKSTETIQVVRLGAESRVNNETLRPVSKIAKKGISPVATSKLLYNLIHDYNCKNIVELGTSFGINTMYMATNPTVKVITFEGCPNTAQIAKKNFIRHDYNNIRLIEGNIDHTLPVFCKQQEEKIDLVYMDANHRYEPTIRYFEHLLNRIHEESIIIVDDINWSKEMSMAWNKLKNDPNVTTSVDLYELGILFFKPALEKKHYKLMF